MTKNEFAFALLCLYVITVITVEATAGPHGSSGWSVVLADAGFLLFFLSYLGVKSLEENGKNAAWRSTLFLFPSLVVYGVVAVFMASDLINFHEIMEKVICAIIGIASVIYVIGMSIVLSDKWRLAIAGKSR